ncbi:hypothetical protein JCM17845_05830 [Iodidimonas gelatinilytica]|uniref:AAA+ ATPase domain-containing protein n=1 Tax=Iodidimonas gelatinilytica TaxID=1236966 RepID=A0A5A7MY53_9PROT|nr:hypothetical protein JCM17845_05830 [Iodidimonas gelatinilytica]
MAGAASLDAVRRGGKVALAQALSDLERAPDARATLSLLDAAYHAPKGHVIGLTGPPGVGKSTLAAALVRHWRSMGESVGVVAVDPSSKIGGGSLLGDRMRMAADPEDQNLFIRSMAAGGQLGGLSESAFPAIILMRALFDRVLVETVGVGQSETDISGVADSVVFCVQPVRGIACNS